MNFQWHELTLLLEKNHENINPGKETKKSSGFARNVETFNTEGQEKKGLRDLGYFLRKSLV